MNLSPRIKLLFVFLLLISISVTLFFAQNKQQTKTQAAGSTTLYLLFAPSSNNFVTKNVGDTISADMMVDPGNNAVSFVKFQIKYDSSKLQLSTTTPFTLNTSAFPTTIEGPVASNGI